MLLSGDDEEYAKSSSREVQTSSFTRAHLAILTLVAIGCIAGFSVIFSNLAPVGKTGKSIVGPVGPEGEDGADGKDGATGSAGTNGTNGVTGPEGKNGSNCEFLGEWQTGVTSQGCSFVGFLNKTYATEFAFTSIAPPSADARWDLVCACSSGGGGSGGNPNFIAIATTTMTITGNNAIVLTAPYTVGITLPPSFSPGVIQALPLDTTGVSFFFLCN